MLFRLYNLLVCTVYPVLLGACDDEWTPDDARAFRHVMSVSVVTQALFDLFLLAWIPFAEFFLAVFLTVISAHPEVATAVFDHGVVPLSKANAPRLETLERYVRRLAGRAYAKVSDQAGVYWRQVVHEGALASLIATIGAGEDPDKSD